MKETGQRFVGIDLAKRSFVAKILTLGIEKGIVLKGSTDEKGLKKLFGQLKPEDTVGLEACSLGFWLGKQLISHVGCKVLVLNAGNLAIIYKSVKKTDLNDAGKLAWIIERLPEHELPCVSFPTDEEEDRRAMVSELHSKKGLRTQMINRLHSIFTREGLTGIKKKDLATTAAREGSATLLTNRASKEATRLLAEIFLIEKHIQIIEGEMAVSIENDSKAELLFTIPGVGIQTAMAFLAHVGDGSRFAKGRQVSNYVGMTPRVFSSGETERSGHISKHGCKALRGIIIQSAWSAVHTKKSNLFKRKYEELVPRLGKKRAIVAIARRMLETMWLMVVRKERFYGYDELAHRLKLQRIHTQAKKAKNMGMVA